jgi:hypothetical protein
MRKRIKIILWIGLPLLFIVGLIIWHLAELTFAFSFPEPHNIDLNVKFATKLVNDFDKYGKIYQLDDLTRYQKYINGIAVSTKITSSDSLNDNNTDIDNLNIKNKVNNFNSRRIYYKDLLKKLQIDNTVLEDFRSRLEKSKLREYHRIDKYSIFVIDGFLDDIWGYYYIHGKDSAQTDFFVHEFSIHTIEKIAPNWYRFGGH